MLWDLTSTQQRHVLMENGGPTREAIRRMAFSATGHRLAFSTWSLITSKSPVWRSWMISFSPNGQHLAVGTLSGLICLWGLQSEDCAIELRGHTEAVYCIAYSPCGGWIASGSEDRTVRVWRRRRPPGDTESWSCVSTIHGYFDKVFDIAWNPTVPMEFVTGCKDGSVRVWRVSSNGEDVFVKLLWGTNLAVLHADGVMLKGTTGLSPIQKKLLVQRGAIDDSLTLEEVGGLGVQE
ncbi:hypothetical protein BGZ88_006037 [Linnemannia elongata]|nr:hypothetical protein BGZ88_006037 [Linnemannia elongata]